MVVGFDTVCHHGLVTCALLIRYLLSCSGCWELGVDEWGVLREVLLMELC